MKLDFSEIFKSCRTPEDIQRVKQETLQAMDEEHQQTMAAMQAEAIAWNNEFEKVSARCEELRHKNSEGCQEALKELEAFAKKFRSEFVNKF